MSMYSDAISSKELLDDLRRRAIVAACEARGALAAYQKAAIDCAKQELRKKIGQSIYHEPECIVDFKDGKSEVKLLSFEESEYSFEPYVTYRFKTSKGAWSKTVQSMKVDCMTNFVEPKEKTQAT